MTITNIDLWNEQWDYLIILDACRYDYFENNWRQYLPQGQLSCRRSVGSCTDEWRDKTFPDFYKNLVYITANPQISLSSRVYGFIASEHFQYVHELWRENWDDENGTVLPETVSRRAREIVAQYPQGMRYVIHYLQPHAPYLNIAYERRLQSLDEFNQFLIDPEKENHPPTFRSRILRAILPLFKNNHILTSHPDWLLRKILGIPPKGPMESALRKLGLKGLRHAYEINVRTVLASVAGLIEHLSGTIIITSDHGELLGENRQFSHPRGSRHSLLRNVPWFVIKKDKLAKPSVVMEITHPLNEHDKEQKDKAVIERLRALGYY